MTIMTIPRLAARVAALPSARRASASRVPLVAPIVAAWRLVVRSLILGATRPKVER